MPQVNTKRGRHDASGMEGRLRARLPFENVTPRDGMSQCIVTAS